MLFSDKKIRKLSAKRMNEIVEDPRFKARLAKTYFTPISRLHDIPFVSACNEDGTVVFIDRHFNPILNTRDITRYIKIHELVERAVLDLFDVDYNVAHYVALHYEKIAVESAGIDWVQYCTHNRTYAKQLKEVAVLPADIYLVPYIGDPKEVKLMRARMVKVVETKISLQYHTELNPKLWTGFNIQSDVRERLLAIGHMWAEYTHIPKVIIQDVIMTGGNANYNYTDKSDIDVHVVFSHEALGLSKEFLADYLQDKKTLWSISHGITIKGYPVELYGQDKSDAYPKNQGIYSLMHNDWVQTPTHLQIDFAHDPLLKKKVMFYVHQIDTVIKTKADLDTCKVLRTKLKEMRGAAIAAGGEFSFENLVFKELRNRGYLDKINKYMKKLKDKELSL
jgi:hypothetical protein